MPKNFIRYAIVELAPDETGDVFRVLEIFETMDDAKIVLKALEEVNVLFRCYRIAELDSKTQVGYLWEKADALKLITIDWSKD